MIDRIIRFSVNNRILVILIVTTLSIIGWWCMKRLPLDAIPDLSETQVIIYSRWDRSPDIIEDQVTYPIVTAMLSAPKVKTVRGFSDFGYSFVYVIFDEGTDIYWARSRTQEYLSPVLSRLPAGVRTELGPDATGLGWIYQYVLVDKGATHSLADLRSYQDWYLRYYLKGVPGVAEVASLGGYNRQYQVQLDPNRLQLYGISITAVADAVRRGNAETGGRLIEFGGTEYMVRGKGYARSIDEFASIVVTTTDTGTPIRIRDLGVVTIGPDIRRGVADLDGKGDVVSGIIVMRQGENALDVINRVKAKIAEISPGLPEGVSIVPIYDRSDLIKQSIETLTGTLVEVILTVMLIIALFLWHPPSTIIPAITIPVTILLTFIPLKLLGVSMNIMSLGGIAIAIGAMVDAAIVVVEQTHKRLEQWEKEGRNGCQERVIITAIREVAGPSFFALLVIAVSFLPVFALEAEEGRLFRPLAYTKTVSMAVAAMLAITLDPALRVFLTRSRLFTFRPRLLSRLFNLFSATPFRAEEDHPLSRRLTAIYEPLLSWVLDRKRAVIGLTIVCMIATIPFALRLGNEFMPPLYEGSILYMPTTMPGISIGEAQRLLQTTDRIIASFPEVERVLGKAGRAETSTDPAPLSMLETTIILKPREQWRTRETWYSGWAPGWLSSFLRLVSPDRMTPEELIAELDRALKLPGVSNAWTMPIRGRIDMLTTGLKTPIGLKISGSNLVEIEQIGTRIERLLSPLRGTRGIFAERTGKGYFLDIEWDRDALARYGITIEEAQGVIQTAIGGDTVTTSIEGRERYTVNVRYQRDYRKDIASLKRVLVPYDNGKRQVQLGELASITSATDPSMIRDEDGLLTGYVYVDVEGRDAQGYIDEADRIIRKQLDLPPGYAVTWSGQYEAMKRATECLLYVIPITLLLILILLYLNTRSMVRTGIVMLAVPFSAIGAILFLSLLGYHLSVGVWVGLIALLGVDAETGVFMLLYLDIARREAIERGEFKTRDDLRQIVLAGAARRVRPKFMTTATMFFGLVPVMWATGAGSDVMKHIAAPMIGGILTSFLLELLIYPVIYEIWQGRRLFADGELCERY